MKKTILASIIIGSVALSACAPQQAVVRGDPTYESIAQDRFQSTNRAAVQQLVTGLDSAQFNDAPVLVATIVNINDLRRTAPLGRTLSEQYTSGLVQRGFNVKEVKLRGDLFIQEGTGELLLSRELKDIARAHSANYVLVGTYSVAATLTHINLRLVRTDDARIIRAHDYALPNDRDVMRLLQVAR